MAITVSTQNRWYLAGAAILVVGAVVVIFAVRRGPRANPGVKGKSAGPVEITPQPEVLDISHEPTMKGLEPAGLVSLDVEDASLADALSAFADAEGMRVDLAVPPRAGADESMNDHVTLLVRNAPPLELLYLICRGENTEPLAWDSTRLLLRHPAERRTDGTVGIWSVAGRFATEINEISRDVDAAPGATGASKVALSMGFVAEPEVGILQFPAAITVDQFVDENGHVIATAVEKGNAPRSRPQGNLTAAWQALADFQCSTPEDVGHRIAVFSGSSIFTVAGHVETVATAGMDQDFSRDFGEFRVEIPAVPAAATGRARGAVAPPPPARGGAAGAPARNPGLRAIHVRYHRGTADATGWTNLTRVLENCLPKIVDDKGGMKGTLRLTVRVDGDDADFEFSIPNYPAGGPPPDHLTLEIPVGTRAVRVPFVFKDLALP